MAARKERSANWTSDEIWMLLEKVREQKAILFGQFSSTLGTSKKKDQAWKSICEGLCASGTKKRVDQIKKKWKNLRCTVAQFESASRHPPPGGVPPKPDYLNAVLEIIGRDNAAVTGIDPEGNGEAVSGQDQDSREESSEDSGTVLSDVEDCKHLSVEQSQHIVDNAEVFTSIVLDGEDEDLLGLPVTFVVSRPKRDISRTNPGQKRSAGPRREDEASTSKSPHPVSTQVDKRFQLRQGTKRKLEDSEHGNPKREDKHIVLVDKELERVSVLKEVHMLKPDRMQKLVSVIDRRQTQVSEGYAERRMELLNVQSEKEKQKIENLKLQQDVLALEQEQVSEGYTERKMELLNVQLEKEKQKIANLKLQHDVLALQRQKLMLEIEVLQGKQTEKNTLDDSH